MKHMHHIVLAVLLSAGAGIVTTQGYAAATDMATSADAAPSIQGVFRSVDDKTGFSRGLTEIKIENGEVKGWIIKTIPRPNYTPKSHCTGCPAPYTDKPVVGLQVISGMKAVDGNPYEFRGGHVLDPVSGKLYRCVLTLSRDGRKLKVRGYVGTPIMGRTQFWLREDHPERF